MTDFEVRTGDTFDVLPTLPADHVHAVVTDPPYGLAFMGRDWDDFEPKEYQQWCEEWASEVRRVLKPGGHLLAFSGNRTHHRLFSGVEDAGFEIRDTITWHYGSGFPKALDVSKAIDKMGGNPELSDVVGDELQKARERRHLSIPEADELFCDGTSNYSWFEGRPRGQRIPPDETFKEIAEEWPELQELYEKVSSADREVIGTKEDNGDRTVEILNGDGEYQVTLPATDAAERWDGFKTALKPATEYVVVARKPLSEGTVAENVQTHGTGALNIDGTRIGGDVDTSRANSGEIGDGNKYSEAPEPDMTAGSETGGRYPSNVSFDESADTDTVPTRYFYTSKASRAERTENGRLPNDHPTVKPLDLMEWLVRIVTAEGQTVCDPFAGSGTTLKAAKELGRGAIGIERQPEYADLARARAGLTPEDPSRFVDDSATTLQAYTDGGGGDD